MSTHNIHFRGEMRKIICGYPLLSVAMLEPHFHLNPLAVFTIDHSKMVVLVLFVLCVAL